MAARFVVAVVVVVALAAALAAASVRADGAAAGSGGSAPPTRGTARFDGQIGNIDRGDVAATVGRVVLNSGEQVVYTRPDGSFTLFKLTPGVHTVDIAFGVFAVPQIRLDVSRRTTNGRASVVATANDGSNAVLQTFGGDDDARVTVIPAVARHVFFVPREQMNVLAILKQPMVLMMLFTVGLGWLMKQMPQDEVRQQMREMTEQMQKGKDAVASLQGGAGPAAAQPQIAQTKTKSKKEQ